MTYIPKNKIITNLYTNTRELAYADTGEIYIGRYWKSYNGKCFTGKNPNDSPTRELIKLYPQPEQNQLSPEINQILLLKDYSEFQNIPYSILKNINLISPPKQITPQHLYPKPTEDDYKLGIFDRYFLYKINEPIFLEVDEDIYKAVKGKDKKYYIAPYTQFLVSWTLEGDKSEVYDINKRIVELAEKKINRRGLKEFLKFNYTKFWLPE